MDGKTITKDEFVDRFMQYIDEWSEQERMVRRFRCRLPVIGVFFEMIEISKLSKITKEYEQFLNEYRRQLCMTEN